MDSLQAAGRGSVYNASKLSADNGSQEMRVVVDLKGSGFGFEVVEKTNWNEGTWNEPKDGQQRLTTNGPDVSGTLRFMLPPKDPKPPTEFFLVAFGADTEPWCDLQVNLEATQTGASIHHRYYDRGTDEFTVKQNHQKTVTHKSNKGKIITVTVDDNVVTVS